MATAYSVSEAFGFRKGVNLDFRRAPFFLGLFTVLIVVGAAVALVPSIPLIQLLIGVQVLNGLLLPIMLLFILLLVNNQRLLGELRNGWLNNILGWGSLVLISSGAAALIVTTLLGTLQPGS